MTDIFRDVFFFNYEYILNELSLRDLSKRTARDLLFLHKVVHGRVDTNLPSSLQFHVPARVSRCSRIFYPATEAILSPLIRMQNCLNDLSPHVDVFSIFFLKGALVASF